MLNRHGFMTDQKKKLLIQPQDQVLGRKWLLVNQL